MTERTNKQHVPDYSFETEAGAPSAYVAGVDEAGRGPLVGPVVAAAVRLRPEAIPEGLNDSKKLSEAKRETLFDLIMQSCDVGIASSSPALIDRLNIHHATLDAMTRAAAALPQKPDHILVDGKFTPPTDISAQAIIKGDGRSLSIAAASIVAKVTRDRLLVELDETYPGYGWKQNKGYPTKSHKEALLRLGVTPEHRKSYAPIRNMLSPPESK
ncbi:MAG: ribonuclease HII [Parvibaculaceae bacterium]|jgi:ribonuclease HII